MKPIQLIVTVAAVLTLGGMAQAQYNNNNDNNNNGGDQNGGFRRFNRQNQQDDQQGGNFRRNRRFGNGGDFGAGGGAGFGWSTSQPSDQTTIPGGLMGSYQVLLSQSIFSPVEAQPGRIETGPIVGHAQQTLVFDAATKTNGVFAAGLEDTESGRISIVHVGDTIAQGKIIAISLEQLDYQLGGIVHHLGIGMNLNGEQVYGAVVNITTLPEGSVDMSAPNADMLVKLKLRRLQELGGTAK